MGKRQETRDGIDKEVLIELERITKELTHSIDKTQFIMQHHLDETRENLSMGMMNQISFESH
jgi:hypothetical protein